MFDFYAALLLKKYKNHIDMDTVKPHKKEQKLLIFFSHLN